MLKTRIRDLRKKNRLSQAKLGKLLRVSQQAVAKWESGRSEPDTKSILKLSKIFNVDPNYLLGISPLSLASPEQDKSHTNPNNASQEYIEVGELTEESRKMLLEYVNLLKIRDMQVQNNELADEFAIKE